MPPNYAPFQTGAEGAMLEEDSDSELTSLASDFEHDDARSAATAASTVSSNQACSSPLAPDEDPTSETAINNRVLRSKGPPPPSFKWPEIRSDLPVNIAPQLPLTTAVANSGSYTLPRMPLKSFSIIESPPGIRFSFQNTVTTDQVRNMFNPVDQQNITNLDEPRPGQGIVKVTFTSVEAAQEALNHRLEGVVRQDARDHALQCQLDKMSAEFADKMKEVDTILGLMDGNIKASNAVLANITAAASSFHAPTPTPPVIPAVRPGNKTAIPTSQETERIREAAIKATEARLTKKHQAEIKKLKNFHEIAKSTLIQDFERKRRHSSPSPEPAISIRRPPTSQPLEIAGAPSSASKRARQDLSPGDSGNDSIQSSIEVIAVQQRQSAFQAPRPPTTPKKIRSKAADLLATPKTPMRAIAAYGLLTPQTPTIHASSLSPFTSSQSPATPDKRTPGMLGILPPPEPLIEKYGDLGFQIPARITDSPAGRRFLARIPTDSAKDGRTDSGAGRADKPFLISDDESECDVKPAVRPQRKAAARCDGVVKALIRDYGRYKPGR